TPSGILELDFQGCTWYNACIIRILGVPVRSRVGIRSRLPPPGGGRTKVRTKFMIDWRKIEQALIEIARINSLYIFDDEGNITIGCEDIDNDVVDLSLTELAKELAERLK